MNLYESFQCNRQPSHFFIFYFFLHFLFFPHSLLTVLAVSHRSALFLLSRFPLPFSMHTHSPPSTGVDSFSAVSRAGALLSRTFLLQVLSLHLIGAHPMAAKIPPPPFIHSSSSRAARLKAKIPPPAFIHSSSSFPSFIPYFQYPNHTL